MNISLVILVVILNVKMSDFYMFYMNPSFYFRFDILGNDILQSFFLKTSLLLYVYCVHTKPWPDTYFFCRDSAGRSVRGSTSHSSRDSKELTSRTLPDRDYACLRPCEPTFPWCSDGPSGYPNCNPHPFSYFLIFRGFLSVFFNFFFLGIYPFKKNFHV